MSRRIVSLCPSITESVCDLGRGSDLVAVTKFCVHPAEVLTDVERVGGTKNPDVTRIVELAPDVVLMNEEENRREDADALRAAGLELYTTLPESPNDVVVMLRQLGAVLDARALGDRFADDIAELAARPRATPLLRFAYLIWRKPWMAAGVGTYIDSLLSLAGGENVFRTARPYPEVTAAEIARAAPDVVLLSTEPFPFRPSHVAELVAETGLADSRFAIVDGELLSWAGTRTAKGIPYAMHVLGDAQRARAGS